MSIGGSIVPSLVLGLEALPMDDAGLDRVCMGRSGEKKLDLLLAGDGGT